MKRATALALAAAAAFAASVCTWFVTHQAPPDPRVQLMLKDSDARLTRICGAIRGTVEHATARWAAGENPDVWASAFSAVGFSVQYCVKVEAVPTASRLLDQVWLQSDPKLVQDTLDQLETKWIVPYFIDMDRASGERPPWI